MLVAHASDTHDKPSIVRQIASSQAEVLLLTGDIMNNRGRVSNGPFPGMIVPHLERTYQNSWFRKQAKKWAADLKGRPVITVSGNHDFISPVRWLEHYGVRVFEINRETRYVDLLGKRWAGFREINYIRGEWSHEDVGPGIFDAMEAMRECKPDVLLTHAPPYGILDTHYGHQDGIRPLINHLMYEDHQVTHHFFGHCHKCGGETQEVGGIQFINGACHYREHEVK